MYAGRKESGKSAVCVCCYCCFCRFALIFVFVFAHAHTATQAQKIFIFPLSVSLSSIILLFLFSAVFVLNFPRIFSSPFSRIVSDFPAHTFLAAENTRQEERCNHKSLHFHANTSAHFKNVLGISIAFSPVAVFL